MKIHLLVMISDSGACRLVHEENLPGDVPPRVVFWGSRTFVREDVAPYKAAYVESSTYFIATPETPTRHARLNRPAGGGA